MFKPDFPQVQRPSRVHQGLVTLFRRDPRLALECAHRALGRPPPEEDLLIYDRSNALPRTRDMVPVANSKPWKTTGSELYLDVVFSVHRRNADGSVGELIETIWVVEVQLGRDRSRALAWSDYINTAARAFDVDPAKVQLLVVSPDIKIRGWLIHSLFPRMKFRPCLLTRAHVPRLYTAEQLGDRIEPAVLSAVYHGRDLRNLAVVRTALAAIAPLQHRDPELYQEYNHLIGHAASKDMNDHLSSFHDPFINLDEDYDDYASEWEYEGLTWRQICDRLAEKNQRLGSERGLEQGLEQGLERGLIRARREALHTMIDLRGFVSSPAQRRRIDVCDDAQRLARWMARVKAATSVGDILAA